MAGPRPPGDISRRIVETTYVDQYNNGPINPILGWKSVNDRPLYPYGSEITLVGGKKFLTSTPYLHQHSEVSVQNPYEIRGNDEFWWGSPTFQQKTSREVPALLDYWGANDRLVSGHPQDARNEAVAKCMNNIADQKANIGEALATLSQTTRLIASNSKTLADALMATWRDKAMLKFLGKSYRQIRREGVPETVARKYLEYVYGFKPLMNDIFGLAELAKENQSLDMLLSSRGVAQRTFVSNESLWRNLSYSRNRRLSAAANSKTKVTLHAQIDPNWGGLRALNQLGLSNPLALVWELVPWSFVVDWVLPIGPVLNALTAPAGLNFVNGSISTRSSQVTIYEYQGGIAYPGPSNRKVTKFVPCNPQHLNESFSRDPITSWPIPGLWFDRDPLRGDRVFKASALALLALKGPRAGLSQSGY